MIDFVVDSGLLRYLATLPVDVCDLAFVLRCKPCLLRPDDFPAQVRQQDVHVRILRVPISLVLPNLLWVFLDVCAMLPSGSFTNMWQFPVFGNRCLSALPAGAPVLGDFFRVSGSPAFRRFVLLLWVLQVSLPGALTRARPAPR
jgi:hypothetical protein